MCTLLTGNYFLLNGTLKSIDFFIGECTEDGMDIYEVMRIEDGVALFLDDHLDRLFQSAAIAQKTLWFTRKNLIHKLNMLISANSIENGNIKIEFRYYGNEDKHFLAYYIPTKYPSPETYLNGVKVCLYKAERIRPNAKIFNSMVRGGANQLIEDKSVFETLLVDHNNLITEGSRSNVFFIKEDFIYTASDSLVLPGVIRKKLLEIIKNSGLQLKMEAISSNSINEMDAAFLSGTSLRVLPINNVEGIALKVNHPIIELLSNHLMTEISNYKKILE